jgi:hypothetical protein
MWTCILLGSVGTRKLSLNCCGISAYFLEDHVAITARFNLHILVAALLGDILVFTVGIATRNLWWNWDSSN